MVINPALTTAYQVWEARGRGPENNVCRVAPFLLALVLVGNTGAERGVDYPNSWIWYRTLRCQHHETFNYILGSCCIGWINLCC